MILADYIAKEIEKHVDTVFVGNGGWVTNILDSISKTSVTIIPCQNEQCAAMAADAYARVKGIGVCISTSGGAFLNMLSGIAGAYYDSVPMIAIVGADSNLRNENQNVRQIGFQEMNTEEISKNISKGFFNLSHENPVSFKTLSSYAAHTRKGPVVIQVKDDEQRKVVHECPQRDNVSEFSKMIARSKRPVIIAGQGAKAASKRLSRASKLLNIPIIATWGAVDLFPESLRFGICGSKAGNIAVQNADLIIVVGSRLDSHHLGKEFNKRAKKILIDIDANEIEKEYKVAYDLKIHFDVSLFLYYVFEYWGLSDHE